MHRDPGTSASLCHDYSTKPYASALQCDTIRKLRHPIRFIPRLSSRLDARFGLGLHYAGLIPVGRVGLRSAIAIRNHVGDQLCLTHGQWNSLLPFLGAVGCEKVKVGALVGLVDSASVKATISSP